MKVVSPFRPFPPESAAHQKLGPFDWIGALRMLATSVARSCHCETWAITDLDTELPVPRLRFATTERRLMLWILEVSLRYLESDAFDDDTILISPDVLVFQDLRPWLTADLGVLVRLTPKYLAAGRPLLNGVQWWRKAAQSRLVPFYRRALEVARTLPAASQRWGADTEALIAMLDPIREGVALRHGVRVRGIPAASVLGGLSVRDRDRLDRGVPITWPSQPLVDFKYLRKRHLAAYFNATIGSAVPA